jgi:hypothetical protein
MARFSCDYRGSDREPCVLGLNDVEEHMMVDCRSAEMQMEGVRGSVQSRATGYQ